MVKIISFTKSSLPYGWMGNMVPCRVNALGKEWGSTEALFQAMRFSDVSIQEKIRQASNGFTAKLVAKKFADQMTVERCSVEDRLNMELCQLIKYRTHRHLLDMLIETDDALLVEDVTARGAKGTNLFWGMMKTECKFVGTDGWIGNNQLGNTLCFVRSELGGSK